MLDSLLGWFTTREQNRRRFIRRRTPYAAQAIFSKGASSLIGLDLSGGGACVLCKIEPPEQIFGLKIRLEESVISARVEQVWSDKVTHRGNIVMRIGLRFIGISADDWDRVIRWSKLLATEEANKAQDELVEVRMDAEDAARLLPKKVQDTIVEALVSRCRLTEPSPGAAPLIQFFYSGIVKKKDHSYHRVAVDSRIIIFLILI